MWEQMYFSNFLLCSQTFAGLIIRQRRTAKPSNQQHPLPHPAATRLAFAADIEPVWDVPSDQRVGNSFREGGSPRLWELQGPGLAQQGPHQAHEHREGSALPRAGQEPALSVYRADGKEEGKNFQDNKGNRSGK